MHGNSYYQLLVMMMIKNKEDADFFFYKLLIWVIKSHKLFIPIAHLLFIILNLIQCLCIKNRCLAF